MFARTLSLGALLAFAALGGQAAEMVYKSTMPDGRVMYGESPMPGAKRVDKVVPPPERTGVVTVTPEDRSRAAQIQPPPGPGVAVIPNPEKPTREWSQQGSSQGASVNPSRDIPKRSY